MGSVWQVASGDFGRDYSRLCLKHDIICIGPGWYGPYEKMSYRKVIDSGKFTSHKIGSIKSLATEVQLGDTVLLRKGHRVIAIGLAVEGEDGGNGYSHDPTFDDVYGWGLQHTRRVSWQRNMGRELDAIQAKTDLFWGRKQMSMFSRVSEQAILDKIEPLIQKSKPRPLQPRPDRLPEELSLEKLGEALFAKGLANDAVDKVLAAIERQRRLLRWYDEYGDASSRPDEHEVVSHMIIPLLLALGWSEQLLAVEWHKVDLAGFSTTPTIEDSCVLVCEAKRMGHGLQDVWNQAVSYVHSLKLEHCRKILLTQGARFYLYQRCGRKWLDEPSGYLNVEKIRTNHLAPANTNAVETLMALTPAGIERA